MPNLDALASLRFGTQAEFDAATKDNNAIYFVSDGTNQSIYVGAVRYAGYSGGSSTVVGANRGLSVDSSDLVGHANSVTASSTLALMSIAYDEYGHITSASSAAASDVPDLPASKITSGTLGTSRIPSLPASKITSGTFADARIASASTWNAKQDALVFNTAYDATSNKVATMTDVTQAKLVWEAI